jgi:ABC-type uncharacterized transport system permease subunit
VNGSLALIAGVVGFFLPHLIALVSGRHWRSWVKSTVAFALCAAAGVVTAAVEAKLNVHDVVGTVLIVFGLARASYAGLWQPTGAIDTLESVGPGSSP